MKLINKGDKHVLPKNTTDLLAAAVAKKRIALLVSKQAGERTLVLVSYHRVLGLVAANNKLSKTKKFTK
jgi:hypothetical protein